MDDVLCGVSGNAISSAVELRAGDTGSFPRLSRRSVTSRSRSERCCEEEGSRGTARDASRSRDGSRGCSTRWLGPRHANI
eukprot:3384161-Prymnesium_polylepis.1